MSGWDPERDSLCLHADIDLGVALLQDEGGFSYVQPVCENCNTLLGDRVCLWRLVSQAFSRAIDNEDMVTVEEILADEIYALADEEDREEGYRGYIEEPDRGTEEALE